MNVRKRKFVHLKFAIKQERLALQEASYVESPPPPGETQPLKPVAPGIIGHWIEVLDADAKVQYRRFLPELLPYNASKTEGEGRSRKVRQLKQTFDLVVPVTARDVELLIFEQSLPAPDAKQKQRFLHTKVDLKACLPPFGVTSPLENVS